MIKIDLQKTDTSKFLYNPNEETFVEDIEKDIPELLTWDIKMNKLLFLRYLALMYDIASPLNRVYQSTSFMTRKYYACQSAGFSFDKDGRLSDAEMEEYLTGKHEYLSEITVKYIRQFGRPEWMYILAYMAILDDYTRQSLNGSVDHKVPEVIDKVTERLKIKKDTLLFTGGEEEADRLNKALYREIEKDRGLPTPENIHQQLHSEDGDLTEFLQNPYGEHMNDDMHFIGDTLDE